MKEQHVPLIVVTAFVVIVFRAEVALLLGLILLMELVSFRLSILKLFQYGIPAGIVSLGMLLLSCSKHRTFYVSHGMSVRIRAWLLNNIQD